MLPLPFQVIPLTPFRCQVELLEASSAFRSDPEKNALLTLSGSSWVTQLYKCLGFAEAVMISLVPR